MHVNDLSKAIIGSAIEVHKELGPGLLESVYEECLAHEMNMKGLKYESQKPLPVVYKTSSSIAGTEWILLSKI